MAPKPPLPPGQKPAGTIQKKGVFAPPAPHWPSQASLQLKPDARAAVPSLKWQPMAPAVQSKAQPGQLITPPGHRGNIIQRMMLNEKTTKSLEEILLNLISELDDTANTSGAEYTILNELYNSFGKGSSKQKVIQFIRDEVGSNPTGTLKYLIDWLDNPKNLSESIRQDNYGSFYNQTAINNKNNYVTNNNAGNGQWWCPGTIPGGFTTHRANNGSATIDHITPVAKHWNTIGYNSNRKTRTDWYTLTSNHRIICQSCNSSIGSGGVKYRITMGSGYSN